MMWLKYAGTIEIIIALSCVYEKVSPLGKPQLRYKEIDEMLYWVGWYREREGEIKNLYYIEKKIKRKQKYEVI